MAPPRASSSRTFALPAPKLACLQFVARLVPVEAKAQGCRAARHPLQMPVEVNDPLVDVVAHGLDEVEALGRGHERALSHAFTPLVGPAAVGHDAGPKP
jgi:hypothetical protein